MKSLFAKAAPAASEVRRSTSMSKQLDADSDTPVDDEGAAAALASEQSRPASARRVSKIVSPSCCVQQNHPPKQINNQTLTHPRFCPDPFPGSRYAAASTGGARVGPAVPTLIDPARSWRTARVSRPRCCGEVAGHKDCGRPGAMPGRALTKESLHVFYQTSH